MFCLTTIEVSQIFNFILENESLIQTFALLIFKSWFNLFQNIINKQWMCLGWEDKTHLKSHLYGYVLENDKKLPLCIRSKLVKLVVDIARLDWPHFYPDFFANILQLLQKPETRSLGLLFMLTTSEELVTPREDVNFDRKNELKKLLLAHMPEVFCILSGVYYQLY